MNQTLRASAAGIALALSGSLLATDTAAQQQVLNLYSSRHYQTDEALYANFEKASGIKVNRIEGPEDPLIDAFGMSAAELQAVVRTAVQEAMMGVTGRLPD